MHSQMYQERKAQGLCPFCGGERNDEYITCSPCRKKQSKRRKVADRKRNKLGICRECSNRVTGKTLHCQDCLDKRKVSREQRKAKVAGKGICSRCLKNKARPNLKTCSECPTNPEGVKELRNKRRSEGKCISCGVKNESNYTKCNECRAYFAERSRICRERKKAKGKCLNCPERAISGQTLCRGCGKKARIRREKKSALVKEKGYCSRCRAHKARAGYSTCSNCEVYYKEQRIRWAEEGRCVSCAEPNDRDDCKTCTDCSEYFRVQRRSLTEKRIKAGLCLKCGSEVEDSDIQQCLSCRHKQTEYLQRIRESAKCSCGNSKRVGIQRCSSCNRKRRRRQNTLAKGRREIEFEYDTVKSLLRGPEDF